MTEYVGIWFGSVALVCGIGGLAYMADKALERRWEKTRQELHNVYASNTTAYDSAERFAEPAAVMCGGCGKVLMMGEQCPGSTKCEVFKGALLTGTRNGV